jgi:hypothetical protein
MKGTIKATDNGPQGCHEFHHPHPISDNAITAASIFSSLITSLTPGTTTSSSTDELIKYNANFQKSMEKHWEDILCLIIKCATSGTPAIPTKIIGKVREANLASMKSINKEALQHGGKELTTKKMKELGAQAEKEAKAIFVAEMDQNGKMEQEELPLVNKQPHPPAPNPPELWAPRLAPGFSVMQMKLDGNCFYHSVSDQLFRDKGAGLVIICHQINNHIRRNGEEFKNFLLINYSNLELTDLRNYINQMGQDGAWAGHTEIYATAWCYKVDITIYSKDYAALGGSLVFNSAGTTDEIASKRTMIYISYHNNNHFNSVRPPISSQPNRPVYLSGAEQLKEDMQHAIYEHHDEFFQAIAMASTENVPMFPKEKINSIRENSQKIMSYIARQLSTADGQCLSEAQLKQDRDQAEERALGQVQHDAKLAPTPQDDPTPLSALPLLQSMVAQYEAELQKAIFNHRESALLMLKKFPSHKENSTILASQYEELCCANFPIMTGLANMIKHLGGKKSHMPPWPYLPIRQREKLSCYILP